MIQRAEMKDNVELAGTAERFRAGYVKLTRRARQRSKKAHRLDMTWDDVHTRGRKLIFQRGMDRVVTSVAADSQQTAACEFSKWDCHRGVRKFSQRPFGKWHAPGALQCRHPVIEVHPGGSKAPKAAAFPSTRRGQATCAA
jgi:hypothetical protein